MSMKALTVDFTLIAQSMRDLSREHNEYYLDKTTGKIIGLSRDLIHSLTTDTIEKREDIPNWDAQMIPVARKIVLKGTRDFVRIPEAYGRPEHTWRLSFTETIRGEKLRKKCTLALRGRGSCKRFKEILKQHPEELNRWSHFHKECWKNKICAWLESISILAFEGKSPRLSTTRS